MKFSKPQVFALFLERENRFVGRVYILNLQQYETLLDKTEEERISYMTRNDGEIQMEEVRVHVPNTGRCKELLYPGNLVILEDRDAPTRKYRYELILVQKKAAGSVYWVSIDSQLPNRLAYDAIKNGTIKELQGFTEIKREQTEGNSRFDLFLTSEKRECYVEVKGVTLEKDGVAMFPDAPTERGRKHIEELIRLKGEGKETGILFVIQLSWIHSFRPFIENDPEFGALVEKAEKAGVHILPYLCQVSPEEVQVIEKVPHFYKKE